MRNSSRLLVGSSPGAGVLRHSAISQSCLRWHSRRKKRERGRPLQEGSQQWYVLRNTKIEASATKERSWWGRGTHDSTDHHTHASTLPGNLLYMVRVTVFAIIGHGALGVEKNFVDRSKGRSQLAEELVDTPTLQSSPLLLVKSMGKIAVPDLLGSAQKLLGNLGTSANVRHGRDRESEDVRHGMACQRQPSSRTIEMETVEKR